MVRKSAPAALGFRVHTAWATAVLLGGPVSSPVVIERRRVELWDPEVPDSRAPYHAALLLDEQEGAKVVRRVSRAVRAVAARAVRELAREVRAGGRDLRGVGLVVGSDRDPATLGNPHVRAHASEGVLFREALEGGAKACAVPCLTLVEREVYEWAAEVLGSSQAELKQAVTALGEAVGRPWRAEEKTAATIAWIALRSRTLRK